METLLLSHNSDESAVLRQALQRAGLVVRISTEFEKIVGNCAQRQLELGSPAYFVITAHWGQEANQAPFFVKDQT